MIDFSGVSLSFGVGELFTSVMGLIGIVGPFLIVALAIVFAPNIIDLAKFAILGEREKDGNFYGRDGSVIGFRDDNGKKVILKNLKRMSNGGRRS